MDYVGFSNQHLFKRINEDTNTRSSIGKHMKLQHGVQGSAIAEKFTALKSAGVNWTVWSTKWYSQKN